MADKKYLCQECGCVCESCVNNNSLHLHREIELLKRQLRDRDYHIVQMETKVMKDAHCYPESHLQSIRDELRFWQEKYNRLYESHKKLQKVNQGLEDKLLKIVDKYETEKSSLTRDVTDLTSKLVGAQLSIAELEEENEQYRNDCNIAVHLLQCKPSNFVAHKFSSLPSDLQEKVRVHLSHRKIRRTISQESNGNSPLTSSQSSNMVSPTPEPKVIRVPIATFPPTAMVYSVSKTTTKNHNNGKPVGKTAASTPDFVSAAIMAKVLEERAKERNYKNCGSDCCRKKQFHNMDNSLDLLGQNKSTQTGLPLLHRNRSESSSSGDSSNFKARNGSATSTETII